MSITITRLIACIAANRVVVVIDRCRGGANLFRVTFLASDAFVRTNRRATAMMFVRPSVCLHCDRTVHVSADLSLWLDSPVFWAP